jgi:hypothetical protein
VAATAAAALKIFLAQISLEAPPRTVEAVLVEISVEQGWASSSSAAAELAEKLAPGFLTRLRNHLSEYESLGRHCPFTFNSSSEELLQGRAYIEPGVDSPETQERKRGLARLSEYISFLQGIDPAEFEAVARGVLTEIGVEEARLTPYSGDEGIDFYGRLRLADPSAEADVFQQLNIWMVGQAKHYQATKVATPDIRELVGAVVLARARAFGASTEVYDDLVIRACDPVFYLFFTTGQISANGWRVLNRSGVVGMDGEMVAAFLASRSIGTGSQGCDADAITVWVADLT